MSIDLYQKQEKIYQRKVHGFFEQIRTITIWLTMGFYFLIPWIPWDGRQAVLFDLPKRQFHIFFLTFWPQDFFLLSWGLIILAFALFFFTNLAGRLWCGYTCPQTVWTKFFVWCEEITEGSRLQRIKLDQSPLSVHKIFKKTAKHLLWIGLSLATALTFVGYFSPIQSLLYGLFHGALGGWALFWILFFTLATYMNAGWLREQVCKYMCPYARFQSVMFDKNTLIISYDKKRGEPRGSRKREQNLTESGLGDCINCHMCVQVCPTGIDIRDGLQIDCIGCAACIDACNSVMEQMNYPKGLVRYTTENALDGRKTRLLRPRLLGYGGMLAVMSIAFCWVLFSRVPLQLDIIRDRNALYRETNEGYIQNTYTLKIMNMTQDSKTYQVSLIEPEFIHYHGPETVEARPNEILAVPVHLEADPQNLSQTNIEVVFQVKSQDGFETITEHNRFLGPLSRPRS